MMEYRRWKLRAAGLFFSSSIFNFPSSFSFRRRRCTGSAPVVAALFGRLKKCRNGLRITLFHQALEFLQISDKGVQRFREIAAVGQGDVAPHFGRAGRDARRVAKAVGAKLGLQLRLRGIQNQVRQRGGRHVRQMA